MDHSETGDSQQHLRNHTGLV